MTHRNRVIMLGDGNTASMGDLIRFRNGASAVMRIDRSEDIFKLGIRIYGLTVRGETHAVWASDCRASTAMDKAHWGDTRRDRIIWSEEA